MVKFLLVFFILSLVEVYVFIAVGDEIGAGWTVFLTLLTAVMGGALVRIQGFHMFTQAQMELQRGELPAQKLLEGVCLLISGVLLFTPGFVTDTLGFLLLIPILRRTFVGVLLARSVLSFSQQSPFFKQSGRDDDIIEGEVVNKKKNDTLLNDKDD